MPISGTRVPSSAVARPTTRHARACDVKRMTHAGLDLQPAEVIYNDDPRYFAAQLQNRVANAARESMLAQGTRCIATCSTGKRSWIDLRATGSYSAWTGVDAVR